MCMIIVHGFSNKLCNGEQGLTIEAFSTFYKCVKLNVK